MSLANSRYSIKEDKEAAVQQMFTSIAHYYDLNNTLLSLGLHHYWKRCTIKQADLKPGNRVIDIGAGTLDLAIRALPMVLQKGEAEKKAVALDLNEKMLQIGLAKARRRGLGRFIQTVVGSAESIPFPEMSFDTALTGFCLRNVDDVSKAAEEIHRVLKPGGRLVCLEFSKPLRPMFRRLYDFYSFTLLPRVGTFISRDHTGVYRYLPDSIRKFPNQATLTQIFRDAGFASVRYLNLSGGIVALHIGVR